MHQLALTYTQGYKCHITDQSRKHTGGPGACLANEATVLEFKLLRTEAERL